MDYKIKGIEGRKPSVTFLCTACNLKLHAPLSDAGSNTVCPTCSTPLQVPGTDELAKWQSWRGQEEDSIRSMQDVALADKQRQAQANRSMQAEMRENRIQRKKQAQLFEQTADGLGSHTRINRWLAQAVSKLNATLFIVYVVGCPLGGLVAGLVIGTSSVERIEGALIGLIGGAIVGLVAGVVYCGFIALLINMSNNLQLLADERR